MLQAINIEKKFGDFVVLDNFSAHFKKGEINILAGADGSGKSTLFRILLGLTKRDSGEIYIEGRSINENFLEVTRIAGYMPERFSLYTDLTVEENMDFFADIYGVPRKRRDELKKKLLDRTGMEGFKKRRAGALSGGMKQKLALSTILLSSPRLIFLDEPTTGVDPLSRIEFFNIIQFLKEEGKTIIISTPYLDEAEKGDNIFFLKDGKILKSGSLTELKSSVKFRLYSLLPKGNVFDIIEKFERDRRFSGKIYLRGKFIKFISVGDEKLVNLIPHTEISETKPNLEDIYLFYERGGNG